MSHDNRGSWHYFNEIKYVNISPVCALSITSLFMFYELNSHPFGAAIFDALSRPPYQPIRSGLPHQFGSTLSTKWPSQSGLSLNKTWRFLVLGVSGCFFLVLGVSWCLLSLKGGMTQKLGIWHGSVMDWGYLPITCLPSQPVTCGPVCCVWRYPTATRVGNQSIPQWNIDKVWQLVPNQTHRVLTRGLSPCLAPIWLAIFSPSF